MMEIETSFSIRILARAEASCLIFGAKEAAASNLVDVFRPKKKYSQAKVFAPVSMVSTLAAVIFVTSGLALAATGQDAAGSGPGSGPPPSSVGIFPLSQVHRGLKGTAWTVFEGSTPEPMEVEILGVLRGERGPGRDLILARLHGAKPEYTGVVAGMSGSPVYIDGKLAGALSYRIGQFSKEPIAGITPIEQMLEVRDLPMGGTAVAKAAPPSGTSRPEMGRSGDGANQGLKADTTDATGMSFAAMDTPLLMSGFQPDAIRVWKEQVAGSGLEVVSAGGAMGGAGRHEDSEADSAPVVPGSAVSLLLVRGDLEIAATCTVTYIDPKQLLACGHPVMQSGPVSLPMTAAEVVATVPSPLNAFKIINTGRTIGAFTEDRDAGIRGELGAQAKMIPVSISLVGNGGAGEGETIQRHLEVVDLPSTTPSAVLVSVYETLLESNQSTAETSYHVAGSIRLAGQAPVTVDAWGTPGEQMASQLAAALGVGEEFNRLYTNADRLGPMEGVELRIEAIPQDLRTELESVRLISSSIVHAGDTVVVEATLRTWEKQARNVRIPFTLPARLEPGTLRLLVGSAAALDRTLDAAQPPGRPAGEASVAARLRRQHRGDQVYVSLLLPESQASLEGHTLQGIPLSMANTMESQRSGVDVGLHGESVVVAAEAPAGGVLNGLQILSLRVEAGGGLH